MSYDSEFYRFTTPAERQIASALIREILSRGYAISVCDGEETTLNHSTDLDAIKLALATTGEDYLYLSIKEGEEVTRLGAEYFYLVWGNGVDLISDYAGKDLKPLDDIWESLRPVMEGVQ